VKLPWKGILASASKSGRAAASSASSAGASFGSRLKLKPPNSPSSPRNVFSVRSKSGNGLTVVDGKVVCHLPLTSSRRARAAVDI
jgi:hypothetical protein